MHRATLRPSPEPAMRDGALPLHELDARTILDHLGEGVLVVSDGRVRWVSGAAEEVLGQAARRLIGEAIQDILPGAMPAVRRIQEGQRSATIRVQLPRHSDPWLVTASSGPAPGEVVLSLGPGADPAEQRVKDEVRARLLELSAMSAGVAHEVKNPLATVRGAAQLLRGGASPEELDELCALIIQQIDRVDGLVGRFLSLTAPARMHRGWVQLNQLLHEEVRVTQQVGRAPGLVCELDLDPSLPKVEGDTERLREALSNLVRNAREAAKERIVVRSRVVADRRLKEGGTDRGVLVRIEVEDDGVGVPTERRASLFVPFSSTKADGHGLGLFVARRVVDDHGGALFLDEGWGPGARFVLLLRERLAGTERVAGDGGRG